MDGFEGTEMMRAAQDSGEQFSSILEVIESLQFALEKADALKLDLVAIDIAQALDKCRKIVDKG